MILRVLKTNQAYHFILIPLVALALWFKALISPEFYPFYDGENNMPLYQLVELVFGKSAFANNLLALLIVIFLSFIILRLNSAYAFIRIRTFLPSNIFVLIVSGLVSLQTMHPVYFGLLFLLLSIDRVFQSYDKQKFHSNAFDAGFYIGVGSLFYFNLIFFFPVIWIGFSLIKKRPEWRNFALPVIGLFLPWLFTWSYYAYSDNLDAFIQTINQNFLTSNYFLRGNIHLQIYIGFLVLLTLLGSFFMLLQYDEKKISTRKYYQIFLIIFLISAILLLFVPAVSKEILVIMAFPLTCLISNYLIFMKRKFWGNFFLYLFAGIVIYLQFV
ncbi:DUF6427 family protein [Sunxiuqinia sp. A32]|uniref:DUF6427 family protein n=1 Tax=Sunxiuqinia sp. A32 TaxID=3461496 RepID=UPI004045B888